ncbi:uncharacterized protein LOC122004692 [Zingiber officinale]|uniref:uncharacterized protein LOC122004692 n=1 Tax=Zingiber officinale TaxID=94328 RepID=UPI001C4B3B82|nr:uncharacterized protein LOC122004692 [Zingiber officinale]
MAEKEQGNAGDTTKYHGVWRRTWGQVCSGDPGFQPAWGCANDRVAHAMRGSLAVLNFLVEACQNLAGASADFVLIFDTPLKLECLDDNVLKELLDLDKEIWRKKGG